MSELPYEQQRSLLIIDKLWITLVVIVIGFGFNFVVEKYKIAETQKNDESLKLIDQKNAVFLKQMDEKRDFALKAMDENLQVSLKEMDKSLQITLKGMETQQAAFNHKLDLDTKAFESKLSQGLESYKNVLNTNSELSTDKRKFVEKQLREFYWPILIRLEKDNAIWETWHDNKYSHDQEKEQIASKIEENDILPNHKEILKIIQDNAYLIQADKTLYDAANKYIDHVTLFVAIRKVGSQRDPVEYGKKYPGSFYTEIHDRTFKLQEEYNKLSQEKVAKNFN